MAFLMLINMLKTVLNVSLQALKMNLRNVIVTGTLKDDRQYM